MEKLSARLTERYGKCFSSPVLWNFRQFYLVYADHAKILFLAGREFISVSTFSPMCVESASTVIPCPMGTELPAGFSPQLSWSHYRALMRVNNKRPVIFTRGKRLPAVGTNARWSGRFITFTTSAFLIAANRRRCWRKAAFFQVGKCIRRTEKSLCPGVSGLTRDCGFSLEFMGNYRTRDRTMQQNRDSVKVAIRHNLSRATYYSVCSLDGIPNLLQIRLLPGQKKICIFSSNPIFEYYVHNSYVTRHFIKMPAF